MDDFGVLVKSYGIKPQGKSAPMASSKSATRTHNQKSVSMDPSFGTKPFSNSTHSSNLGNGSFFYDQNDDIFGFNSSNMPKNYASSDVFNDVFQIPTKNSTFSRGSGGGGVEFDIESMFKGSMKLNSNSLDVNDDLIWGFSGNGSTNVAVETDDLLSSDPVDDFFGKLGKLGSDQRGSKVHIDDFLPEFGRSNATNARAQAGSREKSSASSSLEEFEDFVTGKTKKTAKGHLNGFSVKKESVVGQKIPEATFIDLEGSLNGDSSVHRSKVEVASEQMFPEEGTDLDSFFGAHSKKSVPDSSVDRVKEVFASEPMFPEAATDLDSFFSAHSKKNVKHLPVTKDTFMNGKTDEIPDLFSETPFKMGQKVPSRDFTDDYSSIFGGPRTSEVFEEIEGESEERRTARFRRHQRAKARMEQALAEMNQRDYKAQQEQEERHRIADAMDVEMKRWAAGKEGNLRALLSSLQQVLAPELGWRPVTLTDLITSSQVKIAYKKAALCVHPDKVQQKGASLQQKFVAEKIFDLLKEAWNKFNTEELR